uniref:aralkylamine N-acetyltransferase n=2 Tax=Lygus hesperus TaxID=30085 RepID=A0A146KRC8_LYGHE
MEAVATQLHQNINGINRYNNGPRSVIKTKMEEKKGYRIVPMAVKDTERVINFLRTYFFHDEPLNIAVGLLDEPGAVCDELEDYCRGSIPDGVSLMALSPSDELLGVSICGVMKREDGETKDEALEECNNKKFERILRLLTQVGIESDVFSQFPDVDRILEIRVVSVSVKARGQGIAKTFFYDGAKAMAKEKGIPLIKVDCTSHFSGIIAKNLGYECIYQLDYADFKDPEGKPYLEPPSPHRTCKTCVLRVD